MLSYPAAIPLSTASLTHLSQLLCTHRTQRGVRWRRLGPGRQALRAARKHGIPAALIKFGVAAYADARLPSRGADHRRAVPASPQTAVPHQKMVNRNHVHNRAPGERAVAILKTWRLLTKLRCSRPPETRPNEG